MSIAGGPDNVDKNGINEAGGEGRILSQKRQDNAKYPTPIKAIILIRFILFLPPRFIHDRFLLRRNHDHAKRGHEGY